MFVIDELAAVKELVPELPSSPVLVVCLVAAQRQEPGTALFETPVREGDARNPGN